MRELGHQVAELSFTDDAVITTNTSDITKANICTKAGYY